jgi:hypothetical protein
VAQVGGSLGYAEYSTVVSGGSSVLVSGTLVIAQGPLPRGCPSHSVVIGCPYDHDLTSYTVVEIIEVAYGSSYFRDDDS